MGIQVHAKGIVSQRGMVKLNIDGDSVNLIDDSGVIDEEEVEDEVNVVHVKEWEEDDDCDR